jgi:hypothetical protein
VKNSIRRLLSGNVRTSSITTLICSPTEGLGYCCEELFFRAYRDVGLIAARLGCSERAVREHKAAPRACDNCERCLRRGGGPTTNITPCPPR